MILRRLIILAIVLAGLAVSACVVAFTAIYALFALLRPWLGAPGAGAAMFGIVALAMAVVAAILFASTRRKVVVVKTQPSPIAGVVETLSDVVRERPVVVVAAAIGAGILAVRNPRYLASALRAFTQPRVAED